MTISVQMSWLLCVVSSLFKFYFFLVRQNEMSSQSAGMKKTERYMLLATKKRIWYVETSEL